MIFDRTLSKTPWPPELLLHPIGMAPKTLEHDMGAFPQIRNTRNTVKIVMANIRPLVVIILQVLSHLLERKGLLVN